MVLLINSCILGQIEALKAVGVTEVVLAINYQPEVSYWCRKLTCIICNDANSPKLKKDQFTLCLLGDVELLEGV